MHWRYRLRKQELLDECEVPPEVFQGGIERLAEFARPFAECLRRREQRDHARTYLAGLVSDLKHKTAESIAYRHGQEPRTPAFRRLVHLGAPTPVARAGR